MAAILRDLEHVARALRRRPGFSSVAVVTLAIVIGANAAIFSAVHAVLLKRLSRHGDEARDDTPCPVPPGASRDRSPAFTDLAGSADWLPRLTGVGEPEPVIAYRFSGNFFGVLGVPARLGRTLAPEDARVGHDHVVVLADSLWRRKFDADPAVVGRKITLDGESYTVVGVMPASFGHPPRVELWAPLVLERASAIARLLTRLGA
jgi:putative ABC transport system permease protein